VLREVRDQGTVQQQSSDRLSEENAMLKEQINQYELLMTAIAAEFSKIDALDRDVGVLRPRADVDEIQSYRERLHAQAQGARHRLDSLSRRVTRLERVVRRTRDSLHVARRDTLIVVLDSAANPDSAVAAFNAAAEMVATLTSRVAMLEERVDSLAAVAQRLTEEKQVLSDTNDARAKRDSVVHYVVGTEAELLAWGLAKHTPGMKYTGWGKALVAAPIRDTTRFASITLAQSSIRLDPSMRYEILTPQDVSALSTQLDELRSFRGPLRIRDARRFWRASRWMVVVMREPR
jgi:hypothetical protein